jgi:hypothetical protein
MLNTNIFEAAALADRLALSPAPTPTFPHAWGEGREGHAFLESR